MDTRISRKTDSPNHLDNSHHEPSHTDLHRDAFAQTVIGTDGRHYEPTAPQVEMLPDRTHYDQFRRPKSFLWPNGKKISFEYDSNDPYANASKVVEENGTIWLRKPKKCLDLTGFSTTNYYRQDKPNVIASIYFDKYRGLTKNFADGVQATTNLGKPAYQVKIECNPLSYLSSHFTNLDTNRDGKLEKSELDSLTSSSGNIRQDILVEALKKHFNQLTKNLGSQSNFLTPGCIEQRKVLLAESDYEPFKRISLLAGLNALIETFKIIDKDKDGILNEKEILNVQKIAKDNSGKHSSFPLDVASIHLLRRYDQIQMCHLTFNKGFAMGISEQSLKREVNQVKDSTDIYPKIEDMQKTEAALVQELNELGSTGIYPNIKTLTNLKNQRIRSLNEKFGITFSKNGERNWCDAAELRAPNFEEINAAEKAFIKVYGKTVSPKYTNGLKFNYRLDNKGSEDADAYFRPTDRTINFNPGAGLNENIIAHEILHDKQFKISTNFTKRYASSLGWKVLPGDNNLLQLKNGDIAMHTGKVGHSGQWITLPKGSLMTCNWTNLFNNIPSKPTKLLENNDTEMIVEQAIVRPFNGRVGHYFDDHFEMTAVAGEAFVEGGKERARLFKESPKLYSVTSQIEADQNAILYGKNKDGQPNMVRDWNGQLVPNNPQVRAKIAKCEQLLQDSMKKKH